MQGYSHTQFSLSFQFSLSCQPCPFFTSALSILFLLSSFLLSGLNPVSADDAVPPPWHGADIGSPLPAGGADSEAQFFLTGGGSDIWNSSDQFHYVYYQLTGNGQIAARVVSQSNSNAWAKTGVMMRNTLDAGSAFADVVVTPSSGVNFQWRATAGSGCAGSTASGAAPYWVKLVRSGTQVTGFMAVDNSGVPGPWSGQMGTWTCATGTIYAGLCLTGHSQGVAGTAVIDTVQVTGEQAVAADSFVDSIGVCHGSNSAYNSALIALGVRHVRDGWSSNDTTLAAAGVKLTQVTGPLGIGPIDGSGNPIGPAYNGTISDVETIQSQIKSHNASTGGPGTTIEAVEGPNEPDGFWSTWYNCTYNGNGNPLGPEQFQQDLYSVMKSDPATSPLTVIGVAWGKTPSYGTSPLPAGTLAASVDWGNFHAYPGGNGYSYGQTYDTIFSNGSGPPYSGTLGYTVNGNDPANRLDYAHATFFPTYTPKAMAETETGYFTGTANGAVSQTVLAKYVPRLLLEHFNFGVRRIYLYSFDDTGTDLTNADENRGLVLNNGTPKPAYMALKSLIHLLTEGTLNGSTSLWSSPAFTPGNLTYTMTVSPVENYTEPNSGQTVNYDQTNLVHHLLLQKSSGDYFLTLWHEVADGASTDINGNGVTGPVREIIPPAMPTTLTLPVGIRSATLYRYDANWNLVPTALPISPAHQVSLNVPDSAVVLDLSVAAAESPYGGTAWNIPGRIEAENYDLGGEGIAYHDNDPQNQGGAYRNDGVDIENCGDTGSGYDIAFTAAGESLKYTVNVAAAGTYTIGIRVASGASGGSFHLQDSGGHNLTGPISVSGTGGWQTYVTATANVALPAGPQVLELYEDTGGYNLNSLTFTAVETAYNGPHTIPGMIQAEDYDTGGEGIAYHDSDAGNTGGAYRTDGVDIRTVTSDAGSGYQVGWTNPGEYLNYTVNVTASGTYQFQARVASGSSVGSSSGSLHFSVDGTNATGAMAVPGTGSYDTFTTITSGSVTLTAGQHIIHLYEDTDIGYDINWFKISSD
ncbi:MAG: carbohydrate-binding protein [Janthinobacterium lividum]